MKPFKLYSAAILTITSLAAAVVHAVAVPNGAMPGFYLGGQLGYSELYYGKNDFNASSIRINNTGVGGRAYFGYQLNHYIGAEAGFTQYASSSVESLNNNSGIAGNIDQYAYDVVLKGTYPLVDSGFNLYAKAGGAYAKTFVSRTLCAYGVCDSTQALFTYGAGATYNIWPHVPIDFSWTHLQQSNGAIASADLGAIGIAYYFG